jgi:hypothetical protein
VKSHFKNKKFILLLSLFLLTFFCSAQGREHCLCTMLGPCAVNCGGAS